MAGHFDPKQLAQVGATNGQVLTYSTANSKWQPGNSGAGFGYKAGAVAKAAFSGNPKKAAVTFSSPYSNSAYAISCIEVNSVAGGAHNITIESKAASGFTINLNANNIANTIEVTWHTSLYGEQ